MRELNSNIEISFNLDPLIESIVSDSAVVYVGAGASVPAGLPTWGQFLRECLRRARDFSADRKKWEHTTKLLSTGDFLSCAEILQREIGNSLEQYVYEIFGKVTTPSPIHEAIARIPFSHAVTTNYDRLLESAYPHTPNVWTWRDAEAVFRGLKAKRFSVIKVHGDVGNPPSLVLTKSKYRDLMMLSKSFNECLATLFSLNTFLFVGSSLRDHDLLRLMDDAVLTYGSDFGPHYALMFSDEVDEAFSSMLRDSYNIHVVRCNRPGQDIIDYDWRTESVCSFLAELSGRVASVTGYELPPHSLDSSTFCLRGAARDILKDVLTKTGSERGTIAFVQDFHLHRLYKAAVSETEIEFEESGKSRFISPDSALGTLFLQGGQSPPYFYIPDTRQQVCEANFETEQLPHYRPTHSDIRSAMACQIHADGQKVGVFLLESLNVDAFTEYHREGLFQATTSAAAAFTEFRHRNAVKGGIRPYLKDMKAFHDLMDMSRQLRPIELSYLLYDIDYEQGKVVVHFDSERVRTYGKEAGLQYDFDEASLVTSVLNQRKTIQVEDAQADLLADKNMLSPKGVEYFQIEGAIIGAPIRVEGHTATVLVCWSRKGGDAVLDHQERVLRLSRLIANAPDRGEAIKIEERASYRFVDFVNKTLRPIDRNVDWPENRLRNDGSFRDKLIRALMRTLTDESVGLMRVRLWECDTDGDGNSAFHCTRSYTTRDATLRGKKQWDEYSGLFSKKTTPYCAYTVRRSAFDPYARQQHWSMFGVEDPNCGNLDKDPDGTWIVGPIRHPKTRKLLGFLSCDTHKQMRGEPVEVSVSDAISEFQRRAVDLVTDMMSVIIRCETISRKATQKTS